MAKFLLLTNAYNGLRVMLNVNHIVGIYEQPNDEDVAIKILSQSDEECVIHVQEKLDHIMELIKDAKNY